MTGNELYLNVLGINSGTSMDSVDLALCRFRQANPQDSLKLWLVKYDEVEVPAWLKQKVLHLIKENKSSPEEMAQVNVHLGNLFADAAVEFCAKHGISSSEIDLVASHGQTIWYISDPVGDQVKSVITMGEGAIIANKLQKTVVSDFRISEQSVGRQGAPMIAFFDGLLLVHPTKFRACQNIGGISNVCFIYPESDGGLDRVFDYDVGPGNIFIDGAMRYFTEGKLEYDKDGLWGKQGTVNQEIVDEYLSHPYFSREVPKTTGREMFGDSQALELIEKAATKGMSKYDTIATITRITAQAIVNEYKKYSYRPIDELYLCGGGAKNVNIVEFIQQSFPDMKILMLDDAGIDAAAKEAVTFAFQGMEAILGRPLIIPDRVETKKPVVVGKVTPGPNYRSLQRLAIAFTKGYEEVDYLPPVRKLVLEEY
jgi:1,6-anhydro-N-acetylmuramate kinase